MKERTGLFTIKISGRSGQFLMLHQRQLHCSVSSSMIRVYRIHYLKKGKKERLADTCMYLKKAMLSLSLYQNDCMSGNHCNFILLTSFGGVGWGC